MLLNDLIESQLDEKVGPEIINISDHRVTLAIHSIHPYYRSILTWVQVWIVQPS